MNTVEGKLRAGLTVSLLMVIWLFIMWNNSSKDFAIQERTIDSLSIQCDSLRMENFALAVQNARYEIAYELFIKRNPKAASQFNDIISLETE